jgi:glycosyltransferase involved in cell wall biosynthesis
VTSAREDAASICHLIDSSAETAFFRSIARRCDRERFPVTIGSIAPSGTLQTAMAELATPTFSLETTGRSGYAGALLRLVRILRRSNASILHTHCFDPTFIGLVAARIAGRRFVFTRHHSDHHVRIGKKWHTRIDGWCARRADRVIAVSEAARRVMTDVEGVPDERITVVYNGMEPLPVPSREAVARTRQELGLGEQRVILMIGRLHEEKGHRFLFEALAAIRERIEPFELLLAGSGPHRELLEAEAERRGVAGHVRHLGQRRDIPELISLASLVVVPSLAESFGYVVLEAMSLAKPVVASTAGGIPEVVGDSGGALLVPPADAAALAEAMARVLENPERAATMGEAGQRRAAAFDFDPMIRGYERVYRELDR